MTSYFFIRMDCSRAFLNTLSNLEQPENSSNIQTNFFIMRMAPIPDIFFYSKRIFYFALFLISLVSMDFNT